MDPDGAYLRKSRQAFAMKSHDDNFALTFDMDVLSNIQLGRDTILLMRSVVKMGGVKVG